MSWYKWKRCIDEAAGWWRLWPQGSREPEEKAAVVTPQLGPCLSSVASGTVQAVPPKA